MNVFGIGPLELLLVMVVGVIVLGPERIPEVAVQLARGIRFLRGYATDATAEFRAELNELTKEYEEVRKELQEFRQSATKDATAVREEMARAVTEAQAIVEPGGDPLPEEKPDSTPPA